MLSLSVVPDSVVVIPWSNVELRLPGVPDYVNRPDPVIFSRNLIINLIIFRFI